jgi:hypothetical protein
LQRLSFFRQNGLPGFLVRVLWIDEDDATIRRVLVGADKELVANVLYNSETIVTNLRDDRRELGLTFRQILIEERVAVLAFASFGY